MYDFKVIEYDQVDSTNSEAIRLVQSGVIIQPTMVLTHQQSAGRGSRGRDWKSIVGNLMVTYILPITTELKLAPLGVYPIALATSRFVERLIGTNHNVTLKWPNDILIDGKKVSGALHEAATYSKTNFFIAGIGVNLVWHPTDELLYKACNISEFTDTKTPPLEAAVSLGKSIQEEILLWRQKGFDNVRKRYHENTFRLNKEVIVKLKDGRAEYKGIYRGIDEYGAMLLETDDKIEKLYAADVFPSLKT